MRSGPDGMKARPVIPTLQSISPHPALRPYVRAFAQRAVDLSGPEVVQPMPACLEQIIEFEFGVFPEVVLEDGTALTTYQIVAVGSASDRAGQIRLRGGLQSFAVFFRPLGLWQLFGLPIGELANKHFDCADVIGPPITRLWSQMAEVSSFRKRVDLVEKYLLKRAEHPAAISTMMCAANYLFENGWGAKVVVLANETNLSIRQFERRFSSEIGMAPKLFAKVARFQTALDARVTRQQRSWSSLAHEFGYYDQAHMIKDFRDLSGLSPAFLMECLGDMRPPALAAAKDWPPLISDRIASSNGIPIAESRGALVS